MMFDVYALVMSSRLPCDTLPRTAWNSRPTFIGLNANTTLVRQAELFAVTCGSFRGRDPINIRQKLQR